MARLLVPSLLLISITSASLILESPQSRSLVRGSPVSLSCRLDSSELQIVWYKDGLQLDTRNSLHRLLTLPDGSTYKGDFDADLKHGYGVYHWQDGSTYDGDWAQDQIHGKGVYKWDDGRVYDGYWESGLMHG